MRFTKMQGAGNDYVYVDCFHEPMPHDPAGLSRVMSDRHFGVGADGLMNGLRETDVLCVLMVRPYGAWR